jgi:hypothetical protein
LFIGREDRKGNNGSGVVAEDEDNADVEGGKYAHDFLEVVLRRLWEGRFGRRRMTTKTTETSSDDEHKEGIVTRLMSETLCESEPSSSSSTARLKRQSLAMTMARANGADPLRTKGSRMGRGPWQRQNRGYVVTAMTMNDNYTYNNETTRITA